MVRIANQNKNNGFTIMELLVVMSIIMILAAIIMPVSIQARNRAHSITCLSNLKQLGMAAAMYADDYEGQLPYTSGSPFAGGWQDPDFSEATASTCIVRLLEPYVKSSKILNCPNDQGSPAFGFRGEEVAECSGTSYLWNMAISNADWLVNGGSISSVEQSDFIFKDYGSNWHGARYREGIKIMERSQVNMVFADCHASPATSYSISTSNGNYSISVTNLRTSSGSISIAGSTDYGSAYIDGRPVSSQRDGNNATVIEVYGKVYSNNGEYEISRIFVLSGSADIKASINQIIAWVESLLSQ